jgi:hypothetical protein
MLKSMITFKNKKYNFLVKKLKQNFENIYARKIQFEVEFKAIGISSLGETINIKLRSNLILWEFNERNDEVKNFMSEYLIDFLN